MGIQISSFGKVCGKETELITLTNKNGMAISVTNYGANVVGILAPDKNGKFDNVILGYGSAQEYADGNAFYGGTIGRYANRIAGGKFTLNGKEYTLALNYRNSSCLHGGNVGYHKLFWEIIETEDGDEPSVSLFCSDPDGRENFPGTVDVNVKFSLTINNEFKIEYFAKSDKDTVICLTNHSYFNLSGRNSGNIANHFIKINAEHYTPIDEYLIPTGEIASVHGTAFDFTKLTRLGECFEHEDEEIAKLGGYDHNFIVDNTYALREISVIKDAKSGRVMTVYSDMPAVQFYTDYVPEGAEIGEGGRLIKYPSSFCLEPQLTPNSPNLDDRFPSCLLKANDEYKHISIYTFDAE